MRLGFGGIGFSPNGDSGWGPVALLSPREGIEHLSSNWTCRRGEAIYGESWDHQHQPKKNLHPHHHQDLSTPSQSHEFIGILGSHHTLPIRAESHIIPHHGTYQIRAEESVGWKIRKEREDSNFLLFQTLKSSNQTFFLSRWVGLVPKLPFPCHLPSSHSLLTISIYVP